MEKTQNRPLSSELFTEDENPFPQITTENNPSIYEYKEHTKGARQSTKGKHQKGQTRKNRDNRGEKGDERRHYRGNKRKDRMFFIVAGNLLSEDYSSRADSSSAVNFDVGGGTHGIFAIQMPY